MDEMEIQNPSNFQVVKLRRKRRGFPGSYKCAAFIVMVILLGTMFAYIVGMAIGNPVPQEDPSENELQTFDFPFVTRAQWNARQPTQTEELTTPVPFVVIHHSYIPNACYTNEQCCQAMRSMQNFHIDDREWWDIGYNFAVGSNGVAYEGRGWKSLGAHAKYFNSVSIGICLIGNWELQPPPTEQLKTAQRLIEAGVALGFIKSDYKLVGHRQVRNTSCPGDALFKEIKTWVNFSPFPNSVADLVNVTEISVTVRKTLSNMMANDDGSKKLPILLNKLIT